MGLLERLENLIQGAIEGSTNSVLRPELKPVEIETELEQAMRSGTQPSRGGRLAPNSYVVWLHPDAFRLTIAGMEGYNRHCELLLNQYAMNHGYTLLQPRISVVFDTDASLGRREIRVDTGFEAPEPSPAPYRPPERGQSSQTHTQIIHQVRPETARSSWLLSVISGDQMGAPMEIPPGESVVGRAADCDIELHDKNNTISRHHAVFINQSNELRVRDSGSKNGTRVNGNFVPYHVDTVVSDGARIQFGQCEIEVHRSHGSEDW